MVLIFECQFKSKALKTPSDSSISEISINFQNFPEGVGDAPSLACAC